MIVIFRAECERVYIEKQLGDGGREIMTRARFPRGLRFDDIAPFSFDFVAKHFAPLKDLVTKNNRQEEGKAEGGKRKKEKSTRL